MKLLISYAILISVLAYWLCTICFNLPDNYINLSLIKQSKNFNIFFSQNWSFFAPPPKANDKAYIIFFSKKDSTSVSFEILESLNRAKQKKIPFNWNEDILDYIISNSIINISNQLVNISDTKDYLTESKNPNADRITQKKINEQIQASYSFITLINYGKLIAKENSINVYNNYIQIKLSRLNIRKFSDRVDENFKPIEEMYFLSEKVEANYEKNK